MSKSEQLRQKFLKRAKERMGIYDDWEGLYAYLNAVVDEALEEKAKKEKEQKKQTKH
ncbi:MAG: hypothetical protein ACE5I5_09070 [Candidatus Heimdallarchaeota archaeon]